MRNAFGFDIFMVYARTPMTPKPFRVIAHIDMNSYFASCEQQANPFLRGKPIGICEHLGGIIIAPSIEAKKFGIKTGTPVWEAKKLYPKIKLFYTDPDKYRETTRRFLEIFYKYTEQVEKYSIDEAFLDLTDNVKHAPDPWAAAEQIALEIKAQMRRYVGDWIRCSVGIGEDKLIAKIGSDLQKPDGLTVVRPDQKETLYDRLKLTDIPGIASRTEKTLNLLGIRTLRDLRDYPESKLVAHFGVRGYHLHQMGMLQGSWSESFANNEEEEALPKSMGHAYTLPNISADSKVALQVLYKLSEMVGRRLRDAGLAGNIISFYLTKRDEYYHQSKKLGRYLQDGRDIFMEASKIFEAKGSGGKRFKYVGITVGGLEKFSDQQSLFESDRAQTKLTKYLDKINDKYGEFTIARVPAWEARNYIRDSVGFGRMKEFKVKYKAGKA